MTSADRARALLLRASVTVVLSLAAVAGSGPAAAAPQGSSASPAARTVLIVHVAERSQVRAAAAQASRAGAQLRHSTVGPTSYSVSVPTLALPAAVARLSAQPGVVSVEPSVSRTFLGTPDDPQYPQQRSYLAAVAAPAAWAVEHGSPSVRIAVVDSGVDVGHPDLTAKIVGTFNAHDGTSVVTDAVGHGTFVAGVAAASTDNGVGVVGAGYDSSVLAVKIADPYGSISSDDEATGIRWAADHGAQIINLSLGGPDPSATERSAVEYAQSKGVLVVAAAGNDASTDKEYPAAYPGVVAVGATDTGTRIRATFSHYGAWVTLAAPGVAVRSTVPRAGSDFFPTRTGYDTGDGTSFSTPLVAGEAALLLAHRPGLTPPQLVHALTVSAHGYAGQGLGAGQVDFARALQHLPPSTRPASVSTTGTHDTLLLHAQSSAPRVRYRVDRGPWLAPVAVTNGVATRRWASWGYANGEHVLRAADCSATGECNDAVATSRFTVGNAAPTITAPAAGQAVTGLMTVTAAHPGGGALRLVIDGHGHGVDGVDGVAPYAFTYSASLLTDGRHTLRVRLCSLDGTRCNSPGSATVPVISRALHPVVAALSPVHISPNRDRVQDSGTLGFALPTRQSVSITTVDATDRAVATARLGTLRAGRHAWTWRGIARTGRVLADGTYRLVVQTSAGALRGWQSRSGVIDTRAPRLSGVTGGGVRFYPYPDSFRDAFRPRVVLDGPARLSLTVRDRAGRLVRNLSTVRPAGRSELDWLGTSTNNALVPAGTYSWTYSARDSAGNRTTTRAYPVVVSAKRMTPMTSYVTLDGNKSFDAAGSTPSCSSAGTAATGFAAGRRLVNGCGDKTYEFAYARYLFTLPTAFSYEALTLQTYGHSDRRPSELTSSTLRTDGALEVPGYVAIRTAGNRWTTLASMPAAFHVSSRHQVESMVMLTTTYAGRNDYSVGRVRLKVSYTALR